MKPPGKTLKIGILFSIPAIVAILLASPTCKDETLAQQPNPFDLPLHILSEEKIVEAYRAMGFSKSNASFRYLHVLVSETARSERHRPSSRTSLRRFCGAPNSS